MLCIVSHNDKGVLTRCDADEQVKILNGQANGLQPYLLTAECIGNVVDANGVVIVYQQPRTCSLPRNNSMQVEVSRMYFSSAIT